jgi:hypothetical protein
VPKKFQIVVTVPRAREAVIEIPFLLL